MNKKYTVEILEKGHITRQMTVEEIQDIQKQGYIVCIQIAGMFRQLQQLTQLDSAERILITRAVRGG